MPSDRTATKDAERGRAVNVRLDDDLYAALQEAGEVRGMRNMSETMRAAALSYIREVAHDSRPLEELAKRQERLKARAAEIVAGSRVPFQQ